MHDALLLFCIMHHDRFSVQYLWATMWLSWIYIGLFRYWNILLYDLIGLIVSYTVLRTKDSENDCEFHIRLLYWLGLTTMCIYNLLAVSCEIQKIARSISRDQKDILVNLERILCTCEKKNRGSTSQTHLSTLWSVRTTKHVNNYSWRKRMLDLHCAVVSSSLVKQPIFACFPAISFYFPISL